jgi:hypothetical protein
VTACDAICGVVLLLAAIAGRAPAALSQPPGPAPQNGTRIVNGTVLDERSEAVPGIIVTATWVAGNARRTPEGCGPWDGLRMPAVHAVVLATSGGYFGLESQPAAKYVSSLIEALSPRTYSAAG